MPKKKSKKNKNEKDIPIRQNGASYQAIRAGRAGAGLVEHPEKKQKNSFLKSLPITSGLLEDVVLGLLFLSVALALYPYIFSPYSLPKLAALRICSILLLILWIKRLKCGEVRAIPKYILYTGIVMGIWWIITTFFAVHKSTALNGVYKCYNGLWNHETYLLLFFIVASMPMNIERIERVLKIFIAALIPISILAILQYFHVELFWLPPGGRASSTIGNPVPLAALIGLALPFTFTFLTNQNPKSPLPEEGMIRNRIYWGIIFLLFLTAVYSTGLSKGPLIGIFVSFSILVFMNLKIKQFHLKRLIIFSFLFCLIVFVFFSINFDGLKRIRKESENYIFDPKLGLSRITSVLGPLSTQKESIRFRLLTSKIALNVIKDYPIVGVGFDSFRIVFPRYRPLESNNLFWRDRAYPEQVHIVYLEKAVTNGIPGLIIYLCFLFFILILLFRTYKKSSDNDSNSLSGLNCSNSSNRLKRLSIAFFASIIGFMVQDIFGWITITLSSFFWIVLGLAVAFCISRPDEPFKQFKPFKRFKQLNTLKQIAGYILALTCATILAFLIRETINIIRGERILRIVEYLDVKNDWDLIEPNISRALKLLPPNYVYENTAGMLYTKRLQEKGDIDSYTRGSEIFEKAHLHNPFNPYPLMHRIQIDNVALKSGVIKKPSGFAKEAINKSITIDRHNPTVYEKAGELKLMEGITLQNTGEISKAIAAYKASLSMFEKGAKLAGFSLPAEWGRNAINWRNAKTGLAICLLEDKNYKEALKEIKSVIEFFPHYVECYILTGDIFFLIKNIEKAKESYTIALEKDPSNPHVKKRIEKIEKFLIMKK